MHGVMFLARHELLRRYRTIVGLTLFVAVSGAMVLAVFSGARQTATALDRFKQSSRAADVELLLPGVSDNELRAVRNLPGVVGVGSMNANAVTFPAIPALETVGSSVDRSMGTVVDRVRILSGRAANPDAADEITISETLAHSIHARIGDHLDALSYSPAQVEATLNGVADVGTLSGPGIKLKIVGIHRQLLDLGERGQAGGFVMLTPAFDRTYADQVGVYGVRLRLRLSDGESGEARTIAAAKKLFGPALFATQGMAVEIEGAHDAINLVAAALRALAATMTLACAVAFAVLLGREVRLAGPDQATLLALGVNRRERTMVGAAPALPIAVFGTVFAVAGAYLLSPRFPTGVARRADPSVGYRFDLPVVALGAVGLIVLVAALAVATSYRAARVRGVRRLPTAGRSERSVLLRLLRVGLSVPVANGTRMALDGGGGTDPIPVRSSLVSGAVGVAGFTAITVFLSTLGHLGATPRLYGWSFDFVVADAKSNTPCGRTETYGLATMTGISSLSEVCYQNIRIDGRPDVALAFTPLSGPLIEPTVLSGRAPIGASEVALGSATLKQLGKKLGETVTVESQDARRTYTVVGSAVFPALGQPQALDDGAIFTGDGLRPLFTINIFWRYIVGTVTAGTTPSDVGSRIASNTDLTGFAEPRPPVEVERLRDVRWFPLTLGTLVGVLALIAVTHTIVSSGRRRRREFAVFGVLGLTPRQIRSSISWQSVVIALVSVILGAPIGLVLGRQVWQITSRQLGVSDRVVLPVAAISFVVLSTVAVLLAVALRPAKRAAEAQLARSLRSE